MNLLILPFSLPNPHSALCPLPTQYLAHCQASHSRVHLNLNIRLLHCTSVAKPEPWLTPSLCLIHACAWLKEDGCHVYQSDLNKVI